MFGMWGDYVTLSIPITKRCFSGLWSTSSQHLLYWVARAHAGSRNPNQVKGKSFASHPKGGIFENVPSREQAFRLTCLLCRRRDWNPGTQRTPKWPEGAASKAQSHPRRAVPFPSSMRQVMSGEGKGTKPVCRCARRKGAVSDLSFPRRGRMYVTRGHPPQAGSGEELRLPGFGS